MKKLIFTLASVIVLTILNSCAHDESTSQIDNLYAVDRKNVERPGDQGKEPSSVDRRNVERPGDQGQEKSVDRRNVERPGDQGETQSVDRRNVERPGNQGGN
ncbi:hypothetical protein [Galbibacter sp.]|uniref:hypothetical protein n=1 Tax=Galbibacter sp. TaxID=2918471 RepID=UPI003A93ED05